jgi:hypothetical protein
LGEALQSLFGEGLEVDPIQRATGGGLLGHRTLLRLGEA